MTQNQIMHYENKNVDFPIEIFQSFNFDFNFNHKS